jgi:hypothetical protein
MSETTLPDLLTYCRNLTSQNGEDGIVEEINRRLQLDQGHFVEFGAWDGKQFSNTYSLLARGWYGVYIEGDKAKFRDLLSTREEYPDQIEAICDYVGLTENTIDELLSRTRTPKEFDVLSIDIDGYDWHVWHSLTNYLPKVVLVEGNSGVLPGVWQLHEEGVCQGSSFTALVALAKTKGYQLVCHTGNLIFVRDDLINLIRLRPVHLVDPHTLFNYRIHFREMEYQRRQLTPAPTRPLWRKATGRVKRAARVLLTGQ